MFTHLAKLVPKAIAKRGIAREVRAAWICERYRRAAQEILPAELLLYVWPKNYRNKILTVGVSHPVHASEFSRYKHKLLEAINKGHEKPLVKELKSVVESPEKYKTSINL